MSIHPTRRALLIATPHVSLLPAQPPKLSAVANVPAAARHWQLT